MEVIVWRVSQRSESDYQYRVDRGEPDVLVIHDLDKGGKTITNNVGSVIREILCELEAEVLSFPAIYKDSCGNYDGIRMVEGSPIIFNLMPGRTTTDETDAVAAARQLYLASLKYIV